jgi:hypothetical protein
MAREARLFTSSAGSVVRGYLKFQANIPPRWIKKHGVRASGLSRRSPSASVLSNVYGSGDHEQESPFGNSERAAGIAVGLGSLETAYRKESFYRGIRVLLELQRDGSSTL